MVCGSSIENACCAAYSEVVVSQSPSSRPRSGRTNRDKHEIVTMRSRRAAVFALLVTPVCFGLAPAEKTGRPTPLVRAHAHNDYAHGRPLYDALDRGFCSVEADVCLVGGQLRVAHDPDKTTPGRTLEALYLDPLLERVRQNGGRVYRAGPEFTLLIDIKTNGRDTYAALREVFPRYAEMLTVFRAGRREPKAITAIVSGSRPRELIAEESVRYAAIDGRLEDLEIDPPTDLVPLVSDNWRSHFKWLGHGPIPEDQRQRLGEMVAKAHGQGRRIRFWASPDLPSGWRELHAAGVDLINTDKLAEVQQFLLSRSAASGAGPKGAAKSPFFGL